MPAERTSKGKTKAFKAPRPSGASVPPHLEPSAGRRASGVEQDDSISQSTPSIPPALLTRLLHENMTDSRMKIGKSANKAIAKYMEIFVREALARAAQEMMDGDSGGRDAFLEVEDLEKLAPQLLLDF
ncbi:MAG: hypothetical protein M1829_000612 [Trizodia sp. TS-e1964]|nr:MAG: hypothetical protein M1829_000612 [Trizodia sp. TS-e1964]